MRIYLAGKMRGLARFGFPAFDAARDRGIALGHTVVSPADLDRLHGFDPDTLPEHWDWNTLPEGFDLRDTAARDLAELVRCDAIAMLPGWDTSRGARAELAVAQWLGLAILDARTFLPLWDSARRWQGRVVAAAGVARAGKDEMGKELARRMGFHTASFAFSLKSALRPAMEFAGLSLETDKELCRPVMVEYGRAARRKSPEQWIDRLACAPTPMCLTDCRYVNEARWVWDRGGLVIYIERPGRKPANPEEQRSLAELMEAGRGRGDFVVVRNDRTVEDLGAIAEACVRTHFG